MRLAIIGQQAFGKSVLEAFIARGATVAEIAKARELQPQHRALGPQQARFQGGARSRVEAGSCIASGEKQVLRSRG